MHDENMKHFPRRTFIGGCFAISALVLASWQSAAAQDTPFYEGKQITMIIGYNPGGGTDLLGRIYARHLPRYIEGNPSVVIRNLEGGGGIAAANVVYNDTRPDGLTFALPGRSNYINGPVLGFPSILYDLEEFEWIGAFGDEYNMIVTTDDSGIRTFDDLVNAEDRIVFGATQNNQSYVVPSVLQQEVAPNIHVVTGYSGTLDLVLALERREIQAAHLPWAATLAAIGPQIEAGEYHIIAYRDGPPTEGIVEIRDVVSPEAYELVSFIAPKVGPTLLAPPNTDPVALQILRDAFMDVVQDPEFIAETEAANLIIAPMDWEETTEFIKANLATSQETIDAYNALLD